MTYPLPIYLVGCPESLSQELLAVVRNVGGTVAGTPATAAVAAEQIRRQGSGATVLIVYAPDDAYLNDIRQFCRSAPECPVLALTGPQQFIAAMRAGATQVAMLPLEAADCEAALGAIAERYAVPSSGRIVGVTGASGGCGATTIAVNLAVELADLGNAVILAEPTMTVGKLALFFDAHPAYTTTDLFQLNGRIDAAHVEQALHPISERLKLLAADYRSVPTGRVPSDSTAQLVGAVRGIADFVVLDLPCSYDESFFNALALCDTVLLVGDQRIPSVRTLQMLTDVLGRADGRDTRVIVNRYDPTLEGFTAANLRVVLQLNSIETVANDPRAVAAAVNAGRPLGTSSPNSAARQDILRLARSISGAPPEKPKHEKPALLGRLARAFGIGSA